EELRWRLETEARRRSAEQAGAEARIEALQGSLERVHRALSDAEAVSRDAGERAAALEARVQAREGELRAARGATEAEVDALRSSLADAEHRAGDDQ
ncbi:hypothetical protein T484DRAFT_1895915, partial [Baffinella frigidus]